MKKLSIAALLVILSMVHYSCNDNANQKEDKTLSSNINQSAITAFQNSRGVVPDSSIYSGPLFVLNHNYPSVLLPPMVHAPWIQALQGEPISAENALAYVDSLKAYVTPSIRKFLYDREQWNAAAEHWYQEPWTGALRESILGTYVGSPFGPNTFTTLDSSMTTYVLTMYDERAANTLYNMWGTDATDINLTKNASQFAQGSVIIKFAFTTANYPLWSDMKEAIEMPIYDTCTYCKQNGTPYALRNVSLFQFDIIVKDTITAPQTGWVFSTLVYDKNAKGKDAWDKMVPLGAMWGNDPNVNSTLTPKKPLRETVINKLAPLYSKETLGWGGRLSGPNDGAVIPLAKLPDGKVVENIAASSCMSCHSVAQGPCCPDTLSAFLLPTYWSLANGDTMPIFEPGGKQWIQWNQNRQGTIPFTVGQVAVDFDMVTCFKSMIMMYSAKQGESLQEANLKVSRVKIFQNRSYTGR